MLKDDASPYKRRTSYKWTSVIKSVSSKSEVFSTKKIEQPLIEKSDIGVQIKFNSSMYCLLDSFYSWRMQHHQ
jgi:hypothetical protein